MLHKFWFFHWNMKKKIHKASRALPQPARSQLSTTHGASLKLLSFFFFETSLTKGKMKWKVFFFLLRCLLRSFEDSSLSVSRHAKHFVGFKWRERIKREKEREWNERFKCTNRKGCQSRLSVGEANIENQSKLIRDVTCCNGVPELWR